MATPNVVASHPSRSQRLTPALRFMKQYAGDLAAFGGATIAIDTNVVTTEFSSNKRAVNAAAALRSAVNGVKLTVINTSTTCDVQHPSVEGVKEMLADHPDVTLVDGDTVFHVSTFTKDTAQHLKSLLRPTIHIEDMGFPVHVSHVPYIVPEPVNDPSVKYVK